VRHRPYSVLLFDEIEKAHPEVFNILLQVLDNGYSPTPRAQGQLPQHDHHHDLQHRRAVHRQDGAARLCVGGDRREQLRHGQRKGAAESLKDYFRPEFLNRIDEIIIFNILSPEAVKEIVGIQVKEVVERLAQKDITLTITPACTSTWQRGLQPALWRAPAAPAHPGQDLTKVASLMVSRGVLSGGVRRVGFEPTKP
jgi:hypothetical protein